MAVASQVGTKSLQELARRHLWMHFSRMGVYGDDHEIPIIVRGDGCYVYDEHGNRYLDGLSALFCVNAGHGRTEIGEADRQELRQLEDRLKEVVLMAETFIPRPAGGVLLE